MEDILYDETETIDFIYNGLNDEEKKVVNKDLIEESEKIADNAETIELSTHEFFLDAYVNNMMF